MSETPDHPPRDEEMRAADARPDEMEGVLAEAIDNIVPSHGYHLMPVVGIGGSAGAHTALRSFIEALHPSAGIAYVVVLHLSPDHSSALREIVSTWTKLPVLWAQDGQKMEADHIYLIPPGKHLTATNGHLRLTELEREKGRRMSVDLFFRSLADTHGPHAAAIVLSGGDGDGSIGIKRIKERGGLTIVQDPNHAEVDSMPRAALATGMVDWVLPPEEMPGRILGFLANGRRLHLPPEELTEGSVPAQKPAALEHAFREILIFLRTRTGHDFTYYKRATILRRISRRMQVNGIHEMPSYLTYLRTHPGEAGALQKDLLISVTNFFRDREAFEMLAAKIPSLFEGKGQGGSVRVWIPACASGEEAYSIAMLLIEHARTLDTPPAIQVFGCDLDDEAIQVARSGLYPDAIAEDVSEDRLRRFFVKEHTGYRVRRDVREVVLFANHDLLKDAPFSRLDLISCRNLLIYLTREAQERAFEIFHFALKPEGLLFLGSSESVEDGSSLFHVVDKKHRLYVRKSASRPNLPVPVGPTSLVLQQNIREVEAERRAATAPVAYPPRNFLPNIFATSSRVARRDLHGPGWSELHYKLIERFAPPSVLVNASHDIQHLSDSAGRFLQFSGGQPTSNLLRVVHPALRFELRALLYRAAQSNQPQEARAISATIEGEQVAVTLKVGPVNDIGENVFLVLFEAAPVEASPDTPPLAVQAPEPVVQHLERELEQLKSHLRETVEQYEASTEELQASNEELQAMNEELRSATEELETSREELQSINEELTTVNQEMKNKVEELGQANSDLQNLMSATAIATLFLDRNMRIMRFTDSAAPIFNLIPSDVGRPLAHLQHQIVYPEIAADAESVLEKLGTVEREVSSTNGDCYLARMLPYRTVDDRIAGVVLTFVDISERTRAERALAADLDDTERLRQVSARLTPDSGMQDLFDEIAAAAVALARADAGSIQLLDPVHQELRLLASHGFSPDVKQRFTTVKAGAGTSCGAALVSGKRTLTRFDQAGSGDPDGSRQIHLAAGFRSAQSTPLIARNGRPMGMLSTQWREPREPTERELRFLDLLARQAADALERHQADEALRQQMDELTRFNKAAVGREIRMVELKREVNELRARQSLEPQYRLDAEHND